MKVSIPNGMYQELAGDFDLDGEDCVRPDYSGRGMYGRTCVAYDGDEKMRFAYRLALLVAELEEEPIENVMERMDPASDSMGLGTIWYWSWITVEGHESEGRR